VEKEVRPALSQRWRGRGVWRERERERERERALLGEAEGLLNCNSISASESNERRGERVGRGRESHEKGMTRPQGLKIDQTFSDKLLQTGNRGNSTPNFRINSLPQISYQ
jgi:hypothetical protein